MIDWTKFTKQRLLHPGLVALVLGVLFLAAAGPVQADPVPFAPGDVIIGLGSSPDGSSPGRLRHFRNGTLLNTLLTTSGSFEETGPCFDGQRRLFTTNFEALSVSRLHTNGAVAESEFATHPTETPNSCVVDSAGHVYVGFSDENPAIQQYGGGGLRRYSLTGGAPLEFHPAPEGRGIDWIDLADDQCVLYYTSQGASIKRFNVCTGHQVIPDFCTNCDDGAGGSAGLLMGLRVLPDHGVLVADFAYGVVRRYNSSGVQTQTYAAVDNPYSWFFPWAIALDPDLSSFWAIDNLTGEVFKFDLDSGNVITSFQAGICEDFNFSCAITGIAVVGEPRAATPPFGALSVTASITAQNKVYDGNTSATVNCTLSGVNALDDVQCQVNSAAFDTKDVGNGKTVTATVTLTGNDAGIYILATSQPMTTTADIMPAPASVTPNSATKVYGASDPTFTGSLSGFIAGDGVTATYSRTAGETVAGSPYTISATLSPASALGNYTITYNTANFTITKATASVTPNAASKTYGAADPTLTGTLTGFLTSDGVTATYTRTAGESVAGSPYTISATLSPASVLDNYTVTYNTASFTINKATASVTPDAASKTYGTADPAFTGMLTGFLATDGVAAAYTRTAGESVAGSPYTISATLSPAAALANYNVTYNTASFTINKATASVTPNAASKTYGTADPPFTGTFTGFLSADGVTAAYTRTAGESVAGSPYTISATLSPAAALANYNVTYNTASFTINKATASVTPNAASKTYGTADPTFTGTLTGFLPSDNVTATYSRTAGESVLGSPYTISATLSPAGVLANYNVTSSTANFTINPAAASVTPNGASKTYGTADLAFTGTLSGFLPADGVTAAYSRPAGESVGGSPYTISATLSPTGALSNYAITYNTASFTINKATASVTPNAASKTYGAADPTFTGSLAGFVAGDGVIATYSRTSGENVAGSPYTISATLSPAGVLGNYNITYDTATFSITAAAATVTPNSATKTYGTADPTFTGTLSGFLPGDSVTATYSRTSGETVAGGPYPISAALSPAGVLGNYVITYNTAGFTITKAVASVSPNAANKTFGTADPPLSGALSGFLPGDSVVALYARNAGEAVAGSPYTISAVLSPSAALANYLITYNTAPFAILPAVASVTPNAASKVYGTADPMFTGTLSGFLPSSGVTASYTRTAGENVAGSPYVISASLSGSVSDYTITYNTADFTITPATPIVTWADPADIYYPTPLSGTQLNATANVPGTFNYTPGAGVTLGIGNGQLLSVVLTPTDNSNYTTAAAQVHVNVLSADVSVSQTTPAPTINVGGTATYNLTVAAGGTGTSSNVVLTDTLPANLSWTISGPNAASCLPASPVAGGTILTCNFGAMGAGATKNITLSAVTTTLACGDVVNQASVSSAQDLDQGNNSTGPLTIVVNCPAIAIAKSAVKESVSAGEDVSYKVVITAGGDSNSNNVVMTDVLPSGFTWAVTGDTASCSGLLVAGGTTLTCSYGTMAPGETRTVYLTAATSTATCGTINNTATVSDSLDTSVGDNSAGPVAITVICPDVSVALGTTTSTVTVGSNAVYNVQVTANGPGSANNVVLTDVLPAGLTWTVSGSYASVCSTSMGTLTCNFGTLAAGTTRMISLTATTTSANCGVIKDSASVTASGDTNAGNNSAGPVSITVSCPVPPSVSNVSLMCPNVSLVGTNLMVSGDMDTTTPQSVSIVYTSPTGATTTHVKTSAATGEYSDSLAASVVGKWKVQATAAGVSSPQCEVIVYGKSQGGTFVIGDTTPGATIHATADFWGSQWWKDNVWSGGVNPGVASLKGYLDAVDLPANCGSWSTRPGNSSKPPATIPEYVAVIVSSYISKNGPTIAGDSVAEVVVKVSPGYGPAPGHDGFGEIVAVICQK